MMHFENLLGLPLNVARPLIEAEKGVEAVIVASGPPFLARGYTPHWGQERVVRVRALAASQVEILVTRELVGEERVTTHDKRATKTVDTRR